MEKDLYKNSILFRTNTHEGYILVNENIDKLFNKK